MGLLQYSSTKTKIPSRRAELNKRNKIARKLTMYAPLGPYKDADLVDRLTGTVTGTELRSSEGKLATYFDGSSWINYGDVHDVISGLATYGIRFSTTDSEYSLFDKSRAGADVGRYFLIKESSTNLYFTLETNAAVYTVDAGSGYNDGKEHFAICVIRSNTIELWIDGAKIGTTTTSNGGAGYNTTFNLLLGAYTDSAGTGIYSGLRLTGFLRDFFISDVDFTDDEIRSLFNDFYQILQPSTVHIPYSTSGGVTVSPGAGSFKYNGSSLTTKTRKDAVLGSGVVNWVGSSPSVSTLNILTATPGAGLVNWQGETLTALGVSAGVTVSPGAGSFAWQGDSPSTYVIKHTVPGSGTVIWQGSSPVTSVPRTAILALGTGQYQWVGVSVSAIGNNPGQWTTKSRVSGTWGTKSRQFGNWVTKERQ